MTTFTKLNGSTAGQTLTSGWYYVDSNVTYTNGTGGNGITVGGNDVKILIKRGCTLTVTGGAGSAPTGAGAGIYLNTGTLYVYGHGTLKVTGGAAGNASSPGGQQVSSFIGASGGTGGGGAGAAIGTKGANGGAGGACVTDSNGAAGGNGSTAEAYKGKFYIASTISSTLTAGAAGSSGGTSTSGYGGPWSSGSQYYSYYGAWTNVEAAYGGGAGTSIGTGGYGGRGAGSQGYERATNKITSTSRTHGTNGSNGGAATAGSASGGIGYIIMNTVNVGNNGTLNFASCADTDDSGYYAIPRIVGLSFNYATMPSATTSFNTSIDGLGTKVVDDFGQPFAIYFDSAGTVTAYSTSNATLYAIRDNTPETQIVNSTNGVVCSTGWYYVTANTTVSNSTIGGPGINVGANDVKIYIKSGCTLTVTGGRGNDTTGAGAGINLTTGTLYIYGYGTLNVTGGTAANGATPDGRGNSTTNFWNSPGGRGGGGAGAGIGTGGGTGGNNGTSHGYGETGGAGSAAATYNGTLRIADTVTTHISGGAAGSKGSGIDTYKATIYHESGRYYTYYTETAVAGGNGGGAGAAIGTGGYGGGQAGNGNIATSNDDYPSSGGNVGATGANGAAATVSAVTSSIGYFVMSNPEGFDAGTLSPIYFDNDGLTSYIPRITGLTFHYAVLPQGVMRFEDDAETVVISKDVKYIDTEYLLAGTVLEFSTEDTILNAVLQDAPWLMINGKWIKGDLTYFCVDNQWRRATLYTKKDGHWYRQNPFD